MKKNLLFLVGIFILCVFIQCKKEKEITTYAFTYNGKNYEVVKELKTWNAAAMDATEKGGYLVEINSSGEQNAVFYAIINGARVSPTYISVANGGGFAYVWIGANDMTEEGTWIWDGDNDGVGINFWKGQGKYGTNDGVVINRAYNNWGGNGSIYEPDNGDGQDCAAIGLTDWGYCYAGQWNDIAPYCPMYYVIEYETSKK